MKSHLAKPAKQAKPKTMSTFTSHMNTAMDQARAAAKRGEVPVGAVIVAPNGQIIASSGNRTRELNDPTAHAEILAIRAACVIAKSERLTGYDLYVTLEPCPMCAMAISAARIKRLYFAASDAKSGGIHQGPRIFSHPQAHHVPEIYDGINAAQSESLLKSFFKSRRS
jgi:tRNA(Arg) A34 adenosine deaminase TadA